MNIFPVIMVVVLTLSGGLLWWSRGDVHAQEEAITVGLSPTDIPPVEVMPLRTLKLVSDGVVVLSDFAQCRFTSHSSILMTDASSRDFLSKTAEYLRADPTRHLVVTGYYLASEYTSPVGDQADLGRARSASLRDALVSHGVPDSQIGLASAQLDDVTLSKSADFMVTSAKAKLSQMGYK